MRYISYMSFIFYCDFGLILLEQLSGYCHTEMLTGVGQHPVKSTLWNLEVRLIDLKYATELRLFLEI